MAQEAKFTTVFFGDFSSQQGSWTLTDMPLLKAIHELVGDNSIAIQNDTANDQQYIKILYVLAAEGGISNDTQDEVPKNIEPASRYLDLSEQGHRTDRIRAIERLEGLQGQAVIDELEHTLRYDADITVRRRAAVSLEDIGGDPVVNALEAGLGDDDPSIRIAVVNSLGRIGSQRAIMAIGQTIIGDRDVETRRAAVLALDGLEGGAVEAFLKAAQKDQDKSVRQAASQVIKESGIQQ